MKMWQKAAAIGAALMTVGGASAAWSAGLRPTTGRTVAPAQVPPRSIGGGITESKYVPIAPCRIIDTRKVGGPSAAEATRSFRVRNTSNYASQGGSSTGCGIPQAASAIEAAVSVVNPSGNGYLRVWPGGSAEPNSTFVNYSATSTTNTGAITLCQAEVCSVSDDLSAKAHVAGTGLVVDIEGYYTTPMAAEVSTNGTILEQSRVASSSRVSAGRYKVTFDRDVHLCTMSATSFSGSGAYANVSGYAGTNTAVDLRTFDADGNAQDSVSYVQVTC